MWKKIKQFLKDWDYDLFEITHYYLFLSPGHRFFEWTICPFCILKDIKYEIKCFFKPHNVLKIRSLPRTYADECSMLLHASFEILQSFIESEDFRQIDWTYDRKHRQNYRALMKLLGWWKSRKNRDIHDPFCFKIFHAMNEKHGFINSAPQHIFDYVYRNYTDDLDEQEDTKMLCRLARLRISLWS